MARWPKGVVFLLLALLTWARCWSSWRPQRTPSGPRSSKACHQCSSSCSHPHGASGGPWRPLGTVGLRPGAVAWIRHRWLPCRPRHHAGRPSPPAAPARCAPVRRTPRTTTGRCSKFTPLRTTRLHNSTSLREAHFDDEGKHDKPVHMEVDALLAKVTVLKEGRGEKDAATDGQESHLCDACEGRPQHQEEETWSAHSSVTLDQIEKELMALKGNKRGKCSN